MSSDTNIEPVLTIENAKSLALYACGFINAEAATCNLFERKECRGALFLLYVQNPDQYVAYAKRIIEEQKDGYAWFLRYIAFIQTTNGNETKAMSFDDKKYEGYIERRTLLAAIEKGRAEGSLFLLRDDLQLVCAAFCLHCKEDCRGDISREEAEQLLENWKTAQEGITA